MLIVGECGLRLALMLQRVCAHTGHRSGCWRVDCLCSHLAGICMKGKLCNQHCTSQLGTANGDECSLHLDVRASAWLCLPWESEHGMLLGHCHLFVNCWTALSMQFSAVWQAASTPFLCLTRCLSVMKCSTEAATNLPAAGRPAWPKEGRSRCRKASGSA